MSQESAATSPAPQTSGDGKVQTSANVNEAQAVALFLKREAKAQSDVPQTAGTEATPAAEAAAESETPAAESAPVDSPEAPTTEETAAPEKTETEGKETPETEADPVLSPDSQTLDAKTKERIQKRIDKEVGKRKALEAQVEQLRQQVAQAAQPPPAPVAPIVAPKAEAPLPDIKDQAALNDYKKQAKDTVRWAEEVLDREDIDNGVVVGKDTYSKADIKAIMRNARVALEDKIPAQQEHFQQQTQFQQAKSQASAAARQAFPFLTDKENPDHKLATQAWNALPMLQNAVNGEYVLGLLVLGEKARQAALKGKDAPEAQKPATTAKTAPAVIVAPKPKAPSDQTATTTAGSIARTSPDARSRATVQGELTKLKASPFATVAATEAYLMKKDLARQSQGNG